MRRSVTTGRVSPGRPVSDAPEGARQSSTAPLSTRQNTRVALTDPDSYWVGRCGAKYADGRKCINKVVKNHENCLGHLKSSDAT